MEVTFSEPTIFPLEILMPMKFKPMMRPARFVPRNPRQPSPAASPLFEPTVREEYLTFMRTLSWNDKRELLRKNNFRAFVVEVKKQLENNPETP